MSFVTGVPGGPAGRRTTIACVAAAVIALAACGGDNGDPSATATGSGAAPNEPPPVLESGIALAFVYDTSGSMNDAVADGKGGRSPKWQVANRAFLSIVDRLEKFTSAPQSDGPARLETMIVRFRSRNDPKDAKADVAMPLAPFSAPDLRRWIGEFSRPDGPTPLGDAVRVAGRAVLASKLVTKHVLVLTDGKNTHPPAPADALRDLRREAERKQVALSAHFVAFDIDAGEFAAVKAEGATLLPAADEAQLHERMQYILEEKILLEVDRPRTATPPK